MWAAIIKLDIKSNRVASPISRTYREAKCHGIAMEAPRQMRCHFSFGLIGEDGRWSVDRSF